MSIRDSFNKINKHVRNIILILLGLILLIWVFIFFLIKSPKFQSFLVQQTATFLSDKFHAEVKVDRVELVFFKTAAIHHVLIRDQRRDTLAYIEKLNVGISLFSIIKKKLFFNDIQLINPRIHLTRNSRDSVFNYDFLLSKNKNKEQLTGTYWQIDLKNLQINQAEFIFLDSLKQTYLSTKIARLEVDVDKFDIEKEIIFGDVHLTEPKIEFSEFNDHTNPDTSLFSLMFPFEFSADNVRISDGTFKYNNIAFQPKPRQFDINRLSLSKIELDIDDVVQMNNVLDAHIKTLSTREKSGIEIKSLRTKFSLADNHVYLNNLDLKTNRSEIKNSIKLNFKRFRDFNKNIANVLIDAHLDQTKIAGADLAYFPIKIDSFFKHEVLISGHIKGRLSNIQTKQLNLSIDKNIFIEGNLSAIGLPKMDQTVFDADFTRIETNIANIAAFLPPSVKLPEPITKVGNFKFVGNFKGKYNDFKSKFALATDIGKVNADIETKFNPEIKRLTYKGNVQGDNIQIGVLTNQTNLLGATKFDIAVNGQGMKLEDINSHVKGTIQEFGFKGYSYKNIELNGDVVSKEFNGSIAINDPNAQLDLKGTVSLKDSIPDFKLIANVRKVNFQEIKLINKPWVVKSLINVNFKGKNLDNLIGEINLDNFELIDLTNYRTYNIEFLSLNSEINGKNRSIILFSDIANLELNGMFKFKDLPIIVNNYFLYFFNEKNQVEKLEQAANFTFDISLENSKKIIPLFLPDFKDIDQAHFTGNFNSNSRAMNIKGEFNKLSYGNFAIPKILLSANSNSSTFNFNLKADSLFKKDSLFLTPILLAGHYKDNSLRFNVKVNNEKNPTRLNLMADLKGISNGFNLHATSSQIVTNNKSWSINPKHEITFQEGILNVKDFIVSHKTEQIKIHTDINENRETDLYLNISKVNLNDITSSLIKGNFKFYGLINGKVEVKNVFKNPAPIANFQIEKIVINRDTVGNLIVESKWDEHEGKVILKSSIIGKFQDINIDGFYKANKTKTDEINVDVSINQLTPNVLDNFVSEYMYNNKGKLSGKLNLHGPISKPILTGFVNINSLQTTVNFLHTTYFLKNQIARFTEKGIVLDGVTFTDRFGNTAYGGGTIYHEGLKKFYLDVFVKTARIECIRTNYQQNPDFWGNVFANATAKFKGAADALIDIDVAGKAIEGSDMSIMLNSNKETEKYSFLNFRNKVTAPKEKPKNIAVKKTGINMDIDIEVTRACKLHVRFDPATEDKINAEGTGNVKIRMKKNGEFTMLGDYKVDQGDYFFTLQGVVKRKFFLKPGGTMTFVGDPLKSLINVDAVFRTRANPYELLRLYINSEDLAQSQAAKLQIPIDLNLKLRNLLLKPDISFDITFLSFDSNLKTAFDNLVQSMKNNENEMNRQVFGILVFNRFMPPIYSPFPNNSLNQTDWVNTVSDWLSNQLSNYVTDWITNFVSDVNFGLKYRSYNQIETSTSGVVSSQDLRRELQLSLSKRFANNRLIINVGGNFDFGRENANVKNFAGGDLDIEYVLSRDGNVRIRAFSKGQYDAFNSKAINRTGVGISYRQEYENAKEFMKSFKKK